MTVSKKNIQKQDNLRPQFWEIIHESIRLSAADKNLQRKKLIELLQKESEENLKIFEAIFFGYEDDAYRDDIWDVVSYIHGGCGDDGFMDFRDFLISCGRDVYNSVLENPDNILDHTVLFEYKEMHFDLCPMEAYAANIGLKDPYIEQHRGNRFWENKLIRKGPLKIKGERILKNTTFVKNNYPKFYTYLVENEELEYFLSDD